MNYIPENSETRTKSVGATDAATGYCWCVSRTPQGVGTARQVARNCLQRWGEDDTRTEKAALLITELVTNSVQHSNSLALTIWCEVRRTGSQVLVQVWDKMFKFPVPAQEPRPPAGESDLGLLSEHGRGLIIVGALSESWGIRPEAAGCTIWAWL